MKFKSKLRKALDAVKAKDIYTANIDENCEFSFVVDFVKINGKYNGIKFDADIFINVDENIFECVIPCIRDVIKKEYSKTKLRFFYSNIEVDNG